MIELYYRLSMARSSNMRSDFRYPPASKADQSETSFSVLRLFELLIEVYYNAKIVTLNMEVIDYNPKIVTLNIEIIDFNAKIVVLNIEIIDINIWTLFSA